MYKILIILFLPSILWATPPNPNGYWDLDETTGTNLNDEISTNDGTVINGGLVNQTGKIGKCLYLDGTNDYVLFPETSVFNLKGTSWTISMWIKPTESTIAWQGILGGEGYASSLVAYNNNLYMQSVGNVLSDNLGLTLVEDQWNFVCLAYSPYVDKDNAIIYLNGAYDTVYFDDGWLMTDSLSNEIGRSGDYGEYFKGYIDEVGLWNSKLTVTNMNELYNYTYGTSYPFTSYTLSKVVQMPGGNLKAPQNPVSGIIYYYQKQLSTPEPPVSPFTVYQKWDFNTNALGIYTSYEHQQDFTILNEYDHQNVYITRDTINGNPTNVASVRHDANDLNGGWDMEVILDNSYNELYFTYNIKFSEGWSSTEGFKLPGIRGGSTIAANDCPAPEEGFVMHYTAKQAGRMQTYYYDHNGGTCAWSIDTYYYDSIYFNPGQWYNVTQRVVMNSFTAGVGNSDGVIELWVDGRLIFQQTGRKIVALQSSGIIDGIHIANWFGGQGTIYEPVRECYGRFDNFQVWVNTNDPTFGTYNVHDPDLVLSTPDSITTRTVRYDAIVNTETTLTNAEYGSTYTVCQDEIYLIDAGAGNTVSFEITAGSLGNRDRLIFYDGNESDSPILETIYSQFSYYGNLATTLPDPITSTGRYMIVRFVTDTYDNTEANDQAAGFTGTVTFNP